MKTLLLAFVLSTAAVQAQSNETKNPEQQVLKRKVLEPKAQKELDGVLRENDILFNALLKKDAPAIEKAATQLSALVTKSAGAVMKDVKAQVKNLIAMKAPVKHEDKLISYEKFLNPLISVVKDHQAGKKFNIFTCPMVKKSWIQDTEVNKDVRNVYAMEMLECGTQDTRYDSTKF